MSVVARVHRKIFGRTALSLAVVGAAAAVGAGSAGADVRASENRRVGSEASAVRARDVATVAVNPANASHIVQLDEDFLNARCGFRVSLDGGSTWAGGTLQAPAEFEQPACSRFDSGDYAHVDVGGIAFGTGQNVYATFSWNRPGQGDSVLVAKSTDGGRTFATGVVAMLEVGNLTKPRSDGFIRPKIGVEARPGGDRVYVSAWRLTIDAASERRVAVAVSNDGAGTFAAPVFVQGPDTAPAGPGGVPPNGVDRAREQSAPVVGPGGVVYVAWRTTVVTAGFVNSHILGKSTDGGLTWTRTSIGFAAGIRFTDPQLAVDRTSGNLYVAYWSPSGPTGAPLTPTVATPATSSTDVFIQRSTDSGTTWSAPRRLNDDAVGNGIIQRLPILSVAANGRLDVVFEDRRHAFPGSSLISAEIVHTTARGQEDYYLASSVDGGLSFAANKRISDRTINLDIGLDSEVTGSFYPPSIAPRGANSLLAAFGDSREGNNDTESTDVHQTTVDLQATGPIPVKNLTGVSSASASVALSRLAYPGGVETQGRVSQTPVTKVVIVNQQDVAGALAGAVLARDAWGPVLTSATTGLSSDVKAEITRLAPVGAYIIGGSSSLPTSVESDLTAAGVPAGSAAVPAVQRLSGATPAATARQIAEILDTRSADAKTAGTPAFPAVVIVNPASPEAAAASGFAASRRLPVLFVDQNSVPTATTEALAAFNINKTYVIGGTGAVSQSVESGLPAATRLGGPDIYATSRAVVEESKAQTLPTNVVYVADGLRPIDAAVMGAAVARLGGLELLVPGADAPAAQAVLDTMNLRVGVDRLVVQLPTPLLGLGGYRLVASDGGIFSFGDLGFLGSTGGTTLDKPVVGMASTPSRNGYWLVAADGGIFAFGDATFRGSTGGVALDQPIVGMESTATGNGYWLVAADGGIFAFGDAAFLGSTGGTPLDKPVVGMERTVTGAGYWLVASDGGIFAFGDAAFLGSTGGTPLDKPVVGMARTFSGAGYWLAASDGGIFNFGNATFLGSVGGTPLARPIVGLAA